MEEIKAFKKLIIYDSLVWFLWKCLTNFPMIILDLGQILWKIYFITKWKWGRSLATYSIINCNWISCFMIFNVNAAWGSLMLLKIIAGSFCNFSIYKASNEKRHIDKSRHSVKWKLLKILNMFSKFMLSTTWAKLTNLVTFALNMSTNLAAYFCTLKQT
jgi:hypothetical protein